MVGWKRRVGRRRWDAEQGEGKKREWVREIERGFILFFVLLFLFLLILIIFYILFCLLIFCLNIKV